MDPINNCPKADSPSNITSFQVGFYDGTLVTIYLFFFCVRGGLSSQILLMPNADLL